MKGLLVEDGVSEIEEDTFELPIERVDDPVGEPVNESLLVLLDLQKTQTLPERVPLPGED
jgi:hypothetical protein